MAQPILMPKPGQMTEECILVAWHKREGDAVHRGDILFEIETDKAGMEVESFAEGVLLRILVQEGQTVPVSSVCAWVGSPGEAIPDAPIAAAPPAIKPPPAAAAPDPAGDHVPARTGDRGRLSPRAGRLAAALGVDSSAVTGTGPLGRVTAEDVQAHADATLAAGAAPSATADGDAQPLGRMRQTIARRVTQSYTTIPHFTVTVAADLTQLVALRTELRARGASYSVTDFVLAAAAQALIEHPTVNARTDGTSVWRRTDVHVGLAVSLPAGLVVPVVRAADRLSMRELHDRVVALVEGARAGSLGPDDLSGGTFTISNMGMFEIDQFDAIINPGESAILAIASVVPTPVVVGDAIAVRQIAKLTLSADHRLVDGELAARFLNAIRRRLEDGDAIRRSVALDR